MSARTISAKARRGSAFGRNARALPPRRALGDKWSPTRLLLIAPIACIGVVLARPPVAAATPPPALRLLADGAVDLGPVPPHLPIIGPSAARAPRSLRPVQSTDILRTDVAVSFEPETGRVDARVEIRLRALVDGVSRLDLYMNSGLELHEVFADAGSATARTVDDDPGWLKHEVTLSPALAEGEEVVVHVAYGGVLHGCNSRPGAMCDLSTPLGVLRDGAAYPLVYDQSGLGRYNVWGAVRTLELRMPSGIDALAAGDLVLDRDDGAVHLRRWETPGYHMVGQYLVVFGDFGTVVVPHTTPAVTLHYVAGDADWVPQMIDWTANILPFLEAQAGAPIPFDPHAVLKLPGDWVMPGTATYALTLLSESYAGRRDTYFEETLAHEISHAWWGNAITQTDFPRTRVLGEGLATLTQLDYMARFHRGPYSRDAYLARRFNEARLLMTYYTGPRPPVVSPVAIDLPIGPHTVWAYVRGSAALEYLRVVAGDGAFERALRAYRAGCAFAHCDTADFERFLQAETDVDLDAAFVVAFYEADWPGFDLEFEPLPERGHAVRVAARGLRAPLPLELHFERSDGTIRTEVVLLPVSGAVEVDVGAPVRRVQPNPRQQGVIRARSARPGDVDFDLEVDGFDLILCARQRGRAAEEASPEGTYGFNLDFEPRCDADHDQMGDLHDIARVEENFGALRGDL